MESENSVVVAAPSVEEAIIIGLTRLTVTRDEVDIEVVDEGSRGFLGIGAREARVRLTRKPAKPAQIEAEVRAPVPAEPVFEAEPEGKAEVVAEPQPARASEPVVAQETPDAPVAETAKAVGEAAGEAAEAAVKEVPVSEPAPAHVQQRERAAQQRRPPERPARRTDETRRAPRPPRQAGPELDRERLESIAKDITSGLLPGLEIETAIEWVEEDRPTLWISLGGRDADALVGPRARNLHAAQYLIRALIYRQLDGNYNVVVDADGYRKRRRRSLESLAESKADRAVEIGRTIRLRPMPAHERRIVHITLRQDERVSTESVGKGRERAVTIVPKVPPDATA
jgi:spoIIIJ-associated protein